MTSGLAFLGSDESSGTPDAAGRKYHHAACLPQRQERRRHQLDISGCQGKGDGQLKSAVRASASCQDDE